MEKIVKISILRIKREVKMEKIVKIFILRRKREFKMEKMVKISILERKREFKMEKIARSNSKIVISEKSILSNYPKLHMRGEKI